MKRVVILLAAAFTLMWGACSDPYADQVFKDTDKMPAASFMDANEDVYSLWVDLLKYTGLFNTVNLNMDYTCLLYTSYSHLLHVNGRTFTIYLHQIMLK